MDDRTTKFTNKEFKELARYPNGDIAGDLELACIWMTNNQILKLTGDDYTRVDGYKEDMFYLLNL